MKGVCRFTSWPLVLLFSMSFIELLLTVCEHLLGLHVATQISQARAASHLEHCEQGASIEMWST